MRVLRDSSSIFVYWEDLVFLEAALIAHGQYPELAALVTDLLRGFPGLLESDLASRRAVVQAEAVVAITDVRLDGALREVHADSVYQVRGDKRAVPHTTLFPAHIADTVRHALARQVELAATLVETLGLSLFTPEFRERQKGRLGHLIEAGRAALARRRTTHLERADVRRTQAEWKEEANAVRLGIYGELLKRDGSKAFAAQFFRPEPGRSADPPTEG